MSVHPFPVAGGHLRQYEIRSDSSLIGSAPTSPGVVRAVNSPGLRAGGFYPHTDASPRASVGRGGSSPVPATCYPRWLDYEAMRMLARADRMNNSEHPND